MTETIIAYYDNGEKTGDHPEQSEFIRMGLQKHD